nr:hypothetical protein [Tanacetum cinerariifolium]
ACDRCRSDDPGRRHCGGRPVERCGTEAQARRRGARGQQHPGDHRCRAQRRGQPGQGGGPPAGAAAGAAWPWRQGLHP